jgi:hypothetical protein
MGWWCCGNRFIGSAIVLKLVEYLVIEIGKGFWAFLILCLLVKLEVL